MNESNESIIESIIIASSRVLVPGSMLSHIKHLIYFFSTLNNMTSSSNFSATCIINTLLLFAVIGVAISKSALLPGTSGNRENSKSHAPLLELEETPTTKYHIFVASKPDTGSTLLVNMILGLFDSNLEANVGFLHFDLTIAKPQGASIDDTVVTKTHIQDLDVLYTHFEDDYDQVFIVVPNRSNIRLEDRYCSHPYYANRILCLEYEDFTYEDQTEMKDSISNVAEMIQSAFPYFSEVELLVNNAIKRINNMDETTEHMKNMDFSMVENRFGIHGGHRGRNKVGE
jgi:hypothetical protein